MRPLNCTCTHQFTKSYRGIEYTSNQLKLNSNLWCSYTDHSYCALYPKFKHFLIFSKVTVYQSTYLQGGIYSHLTQNQQTHRYRRWVIPRLLYITSILFLSTHWATLCFLRHAMFRPFSKKPQNKNRRENSPLHTVQTKGPPCKYV